MTAVRSQVPVRF